MALTGDGAFYLTGRSYTSQTSNDIWLARYDLSASLIWERSYDFGVTSEYGTRLALDSQGNVIVTGIQDVYTHWITIKCNPQGDLLWSNLYDDTQLANDELPRAILTGPDDEVYVTGTGGPPPPGTNQSYRSVVTLRYNADGSNPWGATYYATSQLGVGLALTRTGEVYVAGDFMLTVIKYVQDGLTLFGDGFESGDTSAWPATVEP